VAATLPDLTAGAKAAAGKEDDPSVSDDRWRRHINKAIKATFRKLASQFADSWIATTDFTLTSASNVATLPVAFEQLRHVTLNPTNGQRQPVPPFNLQELDDYTGPRYRVMGRKIYMEPPESAAGNYRAWYVPRPALFVPDLTVRLATAAQLPGWSPAGVGVGHTLTALANGALTIDGVAVVTGDRILNKSETFLLENNGIYTVTQPGSGGTPWILTRATDYDSNAEIAAALLSRIFVTAGTVNANKYFMLTSTTINIDVSTLVYAEATLDDVLDPYDEYIETYAAALALEGEKSDSSQQRAALAAMDADIEVMGSAQEAGGQVAIADVDEFGTMDRRRRHPLP
jgi:hypothetical protein